MKTKEKKVSEKDAARFANERAIFDKPVKAQRGDIHNVVAQGVTVEFTDRYTSAAQAYKDASKPKSWMVIQADGGIKCLGNEFA
jgi:hypothetical protein